MESPFVTSTYDLVSFKIVILLPYFRQNTLSSLTVHNVVNSSSENPVEKGNKNKAR